MLRCYERISQCSKAAHHGDIGGGGHGWEEVGGAHDGAVVDVEGWSCEGREQNPVFIVVALGPEK